MEFRALTLIPSVTFKYFDQCNTIVYKDIRIQILVAPVAGIHLNNNYSSNAEYIINLLLVPVII